MDTFHSFHHCWFLTGATAVGKSAVARALADRLDAEIISMDSMALYRGMDIGTAKPSLEDRQALPHHLVDILWPHEEFSLAQYLAAAERACSDIASRGRRALFVGGTPLYLKALLRGIFEGPPADWSFRHMLLQEAEWRPPGWLHDRLKTVDPDAAGKLHSNDSRRLIRALEVFEKTGQTISSMQKQFEIGRMAEECKVFVLDRPRVELHQRIEERVECMFAAGLVEEVRQLLSVPHSPAKTARQAVGYAEVIEHVEGRCDTAATIAAVKLHTRQLAKRQMTWFRSLSECRFVSVCGEIDATGIARDLVDG